MDEELRSLLPTNGDDSSTTKSASIAPSRGRMMAVAVLMVAAAAATVVAIFYTSPASAVGPAAFAPRLQLAKYGKLAYASLSAKEQDSLFDEFKAAYGKRYGQTAEGKDKGDNESERFAAFVDNLARIDARNEQERKAGGTAVHGITQFSDMTPGEFKRHYLGYVAPPKKAVKGAGVAHVDRYTGPATSVNWAGVYTTGVNNQGYCGACWAFSAVEQVESDAIRQGMLTTDDKLSVQQLVSCDNEKNAPSVFENYGCDGGNTETAYMYVAYVGGVVPNADYPYVAFYGNNPSCFTTVTDYQMTVSGYKIVEGEEAMQSYLLSTGPLSICVDATDWSTYKSGVVSACGVDVNHCVQVLLASRHPSGGSL